MTREQFERVERLFEEATALPADQRADFLRNHCADDAAVLRKVEGMLAEDLAPGFLEVPAMGPGSGLHLADTAELDHRLREEFAAGERYRLHAPIGEGGFGTVYQAEQLQPVRRMVAIKVIKPGMDSRRVLARFEAERQTLARMNHPGIAVVFDAGVTSSGRPFFVMELVEGPPITSYCDAHGLDLRARLDLFTHICAAVQHAHQKGIIHRDLKPSNILVSSFPSQSGGAASAASAPRQASTPAAPEDTQIKVIDFGIARAVDPGSAEAPAVTEEGQLIGTPEYMSPEQAAGTGDIDTRADIYSLGVLLYELLTGTTPLDRRQTPDLLSGGPRALQRAIADLRAPYPSTRLRTLGDNAGRIARARGADTSTLLRQVRGDLDWITLRAIEPDRERRYESAAALAADITRFLKHEPVLARPPTTAYRLSRFARKHRLKLAAAGAILAVLIIGAAGTTIGLFQAIAARDAEARQRRRADDEAATAKSIAAFLNQDLLSAVSPEQKGRDVTVRQVLDESVRRIEGRFADQPLVEAGIRQAIGESYASLGEFETAADQLVKSRELRRRAVGPDAPESLDSARALGRILGEMGKFEEADALLSAAAAGRRAVVPPAPAELARDMHFLARNYVKWGRLGDAERTYRDLIVQLTSLHGPDHAETLAARSNLIGLLQSLGSARHEALETELKATIESQSRVDGADHPRTLFTRSKLALLYFQTDRLAEAEATFTDVLDAMKRVFGPDHPYRLYVTGDLCNVILKLGRLDEAERLRTTVVDGLTRALGADNPETLIARERLADVYAAQNRLTEAESIYRAVLAANTTAFGPEHDYTHDTKLRLARNLLAQGRAAESEPLLAAMVAASREARSDRLAGHLTAHAEALRRLGRPAESQALLIEAAEAPASTPRARRDRDAAIRGLIELLDSSGRPDDAAAWRARLDQPPDNPAP